MDTDSYGSFTRMATSRDGPNPLRPYYIPPSIGLPPEGTGATSSPLNTSSYFSSSDPRTTSTSRSDLRDLFSDIDYGDYLPEQGGGIASMAKRLVDQAMWNYSSVFLAQPFEVAKIMLQCCDAGQVGGLATAGTAGKSKSKEGSRHVSGERVSSRHDAERRQEEVDYFNQGEGDSDDDTPSYFTSVRPDETPSSPHRSRRAHPSRSHSSTPTPASFRKDPSTSHSSSSSSPSDRLDLRSPNSLLEVLSQLWAKESAWGLWKGTNATFVYNVLLKTVETWTRSLLSALVNVPDPSALGAASGATASLGHLNVLDSPNPGMSLGILVMSAGLAGCLLAPLDVVRTRLILTPITAGPRALIPSLRSLPSISLPTSLLPLTFLNSAIPTFLSSSVPLFLRSSLRIDPVLTPTTYSLSTFILSLAELFVKLPLETVLRRGHVATLVQAAERTANIHGARHTSVLPTTELRERARFKTMVPVGPYRGVWGTIWYIARDEGVSISTASSAKASVKDGKGRIVTRRGQGVAGLWRGWRVGFWGLIGVWGASALGGGSGGEF